MVQQFCIDAAAWLAADPANVVVVHCKVSAVGWQAVGVRGFLYQQFHQQRVSCIEGNAGL
jgi:hypothetical protein